MTRRSQNIGKHGEQIAHSTLSGLGVEIFGKIETPRNFVRVHHGERRNVFEVSYKERVAGDFFGLLPNGISVLAEVKTIAEHNLTWSDFEPHQIENLDRHTSNNGLSLVVWVCEPNVYVMRWPMAELRPGKGLTPERAHAYHIWTTQHIRQCLASVRYVDLLEVA